MSPAPALEVIDVAKSYGSLAVLTEVWIEVTAGEALGIVGPNGAGKTTLLDLLTGTSRCDRGRVRLGGEDVTGLPPPLRARKGLGRTFQVPRALGDLTVFENALVPAIRAAGLRGRAGSTCWCAGRSGWTRGRPAATRSPRPAWGSGWAGAGGWPT